ncbi:hypothetical protein HNO86_17445 [Pseudomonas sp. C1C7]|uniref:hypothetical protein n=1 Tax=Pseudomonas sp. C1C7 TaxID=2735272 RepID=UPI00158653D0|nr:hypothetical protein [Pseudomonas sp. C1C7]NUT76828.1 hypothetical protein [Pseudomonas sp. C1C7]
MRTYLQAKSLRGMAIVLVLAVEACTTQLAPLYDQALVEGLTSVNAKTMELMASAVGGTTKETFANRENQYNHVIGCLDALALQAAARPAPTNSLATTSSTSGESQITTSSTALKEISKTVSRMREVDKKQGVTGVEVQAFKGQVLTYMDQALTYESALER